MVGRTLEATGQVVLSQYRFLVKGRLRRRQINPVIRGGRLARTRMRCVSTTAPQPLGRVSAHPPLNHRQALHSLALIPGLSSISWSTQLGTLLDR